jgi:error-prone DNA polymerase
VRLGLNRVSGLSEECGKRIVAAREQGAFINVEDLARRAELNAHELKALAQANALQAISGHRHQAAWAVAGIDTRPTAMLRSTRVSEAPAELEAPEEVEDTLADYRALGLTLKRHPLALLRPRLERKGVLTASQLRHLPDGTLVHACGIVNIRQRPPTA